MSGEHVFHLSRIDVEPTTDNHVFGPVDQIVKALFVLSGKITGMQPTPCQSFSRGLGPLPVPTHDGSTADTNLTHLSGSHRLALLIQQSHVNPGGRPATRRQPPGFVGTVFFLAHHSQVNALGLPVALQHDRAK